MQEAEQKEYLFDIELGASFAQLTRPENPALNPFQLRGADDADGEESLHLSLKLTQLIY